MLSNMLHVTPPIVWMVHFMIGAIWGLLFALIYRAVPSSSPVGKGMAFMILVLHWVMGAVYGRPVERLSTNG